MAASPEEIRALAQQYTQTQPSTGRVHAASPGALNELAAEYSSGMPPQGRADDLRVMLDNHQEAKSYVDEFGAGLSQGVDMLQASLFAMTQTLGRELGVDPVEQFGRAGVESNIQEMMKFGPTMSRFSDISSMDDFFRWSASALGQAVPSLGAAMGGGGIGGVMAKKAVEKSIYKVVKDRMMRQMTAKGIGGDVAEAAVNRALTSRAGVDMLTRGFQNGNAQLLQRGFTQGATIGSMVPSTLMQAGETEMTLSEAGIEGSIGAVFGAGLAGGVLEALPAVRLIDRMFPGVDKAVAGSFIKDFAKATGSQFMLEGSTEGAQEMIQLASLAWHDPSFDMMNPENGLQVLDAFAAGALVGAVTGGGSSAIGRLTAREEERGGYRPRLPGGHGPTGAAPINETPAPDFVFPEDFVPADNTIFEEVQSRVRSVVDEKLTPAMNRMASQFNEARDKVSGNFVAAGVTPYVGFAKYRQAVADGQEEFLAGHEPVIADTVRYAQDYIMWLAEEASEIDPNWSKNLQLALQYEENIMTAANIDPATLKGADKALAEANRQKWQEQVTGVEQFKQAYGIKEKYIRDAVRKGQISETISPKVRTYIEENMSDLQEQVGGVATELGLRGEKMIGSVVREIEGDPIMDAAPPDPDQVDTEFVFGQMFAYKNEQGQTERYRTVGPNARAYPTYEAAANNLESVMDAHPSAPASAFSIRETKDGFLIAINDSGIRQQLREDEVVTEAVNKARISARSHKKENRKVKVQLPGRKGQTIIDVPTFLYEGRRINEGGDNTTIRQHFETMMGRLFERNMIDDEAYRLIADKFDELYGPREKGMKLREYVAWNDKRLADKAAERVEVPIIGKDGKPKTVTQSAARGKQMKKTVGGDTIPVGPTTGRGTGPGVTGDTGFQRSYRKGVKGTARVTPRAEGKRAGRPRREEGTAQAMMEGRVVEPFGQIDPEVQSSKLDVEQGREAYVERQPDVIAAKQELERAQILLGDLTSREAKQGIAKAKKKLTQARKRAGKRYDNAQVDVRSQGRPLRSVDTDPDADSRAFAASIENETGTKLESELQQARQSLADAGGLSARRDRKRDREDGGPLAKNINRLKSILATFPASKDRTAKEQAEFEEIAQALRILERKPRNRAENNKVNRVLSKVGNEKTYTTSGTDPNAGKKLPRSRPGTRGKIAKSDPEGTKTQRLKPKRLKFKWVAVLEGQERTEATDSEIHLIQSVTNKGYDVQFESKNNQKFVKGVKWLVEKVGNLIPGTRIVVVDKAMLEKWRSDNTNREMSELANELLKFPGPAMAYFASMDSTIIRVDEFSDNFAANTMGLVHELGHVIHFKTWMELGLDGQKELWDAFKADVASGKRSSGEQLNTSGLPGGITPVEPNIYEFKEWMADQFVVWMNNRKQPKTAIEKFFRAFEQNLKKLYDLLKGNPGRYGMELNQTYAEFADSVARRAAKQGNPATDKWFPNNRVGALGFSVLNGQANSMDLEFRAALRDVGKLPNEAAKEKAEQATNRAKMRRNALTQSPYKGLELERWKEMLPKVLSYNEIIRSSKAMRQLMSNLYDVALAPSTSVMLTLSKKHGIKAADKLVNVFSRQPGQSKSNATYHLAVQRMSRGFMKRYELITEGLDDNGKELLSLALRDPNVQVPPAMRTRVTEARKLLDDMHSYLKKAGLPIGKLENYVPKMFNKQLLLDNEEQIIEHYAKMYKRENQATTAEAREFGKEKFNSLISKEAEQAAAEEQLEVDETSMQMPGFQAMRHRYTKSKFMDQFLETNLDAVMANYVNQAVKRAEYNRLLGSPAKEGLTGGDMLPRRAWDPQQKLNKIFDEAKAQGATDVQLMRMKNYVDANLGMYGRDDISEGTRKFMAGLVAYNNMRVLLFTVFASLPDMMGPVIRSNDAKTAFVEFSKNIKAIMRTMDDSELQQMAEAFGIITSEANQHVLTEYVDNHYMPSTLRKWNDAFFKYTGLNWYTDMTRKYALAVGIKSLENAARDSELGRTKRKRNKATKFLREFGLTPKQVRDWVAAGKPVYNSSTYATHVGRRAERDNKIASALNQFVNEAIMSPNASQRPIAASHPGLMLAYHLKGFMYAIYDVFLKRMKYNWDEARNIPEHMMAVAPALGMMVLTAAGMELRDLVTGNDTRGRMDNWEYTWATIERSGLLGPAQLGWDFEGAGDYGQSELVALAGPALSHAGDLISRPLSQTIPKSIPVVSQLPWMRDMLRGD